MESTPHLLDKIPNPSIHKICDLKTLCALQLHKDHAWIDLQARMDQRVPDELKQYVGFFKKVRPDTVHRKLYKLAIKGGIIKSPFDASLKQKFAEELLKLGANGFHCMWCYDRNSKELYSPFSSDHNHPYVDKNMNMPPPITETDLEETDFNSYDPKIDVYEEFYGTDYFPDLGLYWTAYAKALISGNLPIVSTLLNHSGANPKQKKIILKHTWSTILENLCPMNLVGMYNKKMFNTPTARIILKDLFLMMQQHSFEFKPKHLLTVVKIPLNSNILPILITLCNVIDTDGKIFTSHLQDAKKLAIENGFVQMFEYLVTAQNDRIAKKLLTDDPQLKIVDNIILSCILQDEARLSTFLQNCELSVIELEQLILNYYGHSFYRLIINSNWKCLGDDKGTCKKTISTIQLAIKYGFLTKVKTQEPEWGRLWHTIQEDRERILFLMFFKNDLKTLAGILKYNLQMNFLCNSGPFLKQVIESCSDQYPEKTAVLVPFLQQLTLSTSVSVQHEKLEIVQIGL